MYLGTCTENVHFGDMGFLSHGCAYYVEKVQPRRVRYCAARYMSVNATSGIKSARTPNDIKVNKSGYRFCSLT